GATRRGVDRGLRRAAGLGTGPAIARGWRVRAVSVPRRLPPCAATTRRARRAHGPPCGRRPAGRDRALGTGRGTAGLAAIAARPARALYRAHPAPPQADAHATAVGATPDRARRGWSPGPGHPRRQRELLALPPGPQLSQ